MHLIIDAVSLYGYTAESSGSIVYVDDEFNQISPAMQVRMHAFLFKTYTSWLLEKLYLETLYYDVQSSPIIYAYIKS